MSVGIKAQASIDGAKKFQDDLKAMTAKGKALDAEMKALTSSFDKEGKSQKNNAKEREALNKVIAAQQEKAKLLSDQIKKLEDAGEGETAQCYKLREQLAQTNQKINEYSNGQSKAAQETAVSTGQLVKAGVALGALKAAATSVVGAIKGIANAAVNAAKGVWDLGVSSGQWADALITEGNQFGLDVETLQEWGYAARFIDTEVSSMEKSILKLRPALTKKNGVAKKSIRIDKKHTVAIRDQNGEIRKESEIFYDVIDALHDMNNVQARNRKAQELFGKSYVEMIPLIESGSGALRQYAAEARSMGIIISADNVSALGSFDDKMQQFDATINSIKTNLAVAFLPVLELVSGRLVDFMGTVSKALADGLQPEDVDTIVNAFLDMFKFDPEGEEEAASAFAFIGELVNRLKTAVVEHKDDIKAVAISIMSFIWEAFKEFTGLSPKIEFGPIEDQTKGKAQSRWLESLGVDADATASEIRSAVTESTGILEKDQSLFQRISAWWSSLWNKSNEEAAAILEREGVPSKFVEEWYAAAQANTESPANAGSASVDAYAEGIEGNLPVVESAAEEEIGAVERHTGPSAHSKSSHWGHELASSYADGIRAGIPEVSAASEAMAKAAAAPIHYSLPDYGPLREVGKWGGEMIDKYVRGIKTNLYKIDNVMGNAVSPVTNNLGGVSINVYGSAGQDVNQLADIIMARMQNAVNRREAVFA